MQRSQNVLRPHFSIRPVRAAFDIAAFLGRSSPSRFGLLFLLERVSSG